MNILSLLDIFVSSTFLQLSCVVLIVALAFLYMEISRNK